MWSASGGDYDSSVGATAVLSKVDTDIVVSASRFISYWKSNGNNGLIIRVINSEG